MAVLGMSSKASHQREGPVLGEGLASFAFSLCNSPLLCGYLKGKSGQDRDITVLMASLNQNRAGFCVKFPKWDSSLLLLSASRDIDTGEKGGEEDISEWLRERREWREGHLFFLTYSTH